MVAGSEPGPGDNRPDRLEERPVLLPQLRPATATITGVAVRVSDRHLAGVAVIRSLCGALWADLGFRVVDRSVRGWAGRLGSRLTLV
ncbi:MAG: hypothetical protein QOH97_3398 [Actinoplanes sp.]|jgi:hypothetical protein|nr:hypothetical protein [Actinoplanes sp.]